MSIESTEASYFKYAPNVFIAKCKTQHSLGDIITVTSKYGKEREFAVYKEVKVSNGYYYYSIVSDFDYYANKAEKAKEHAVNAAKRANAAYSSSQEGKDFLALGEPIKIGHHSETRHRNLIERNNNRMRKAISESEKAESYINKAAYYEKKAKEVTLADPTSLEYFEQKLAEATEYHQGLKSGKYPKEHGYSMQYANKRKKDLAKKVKLARELWLLDSEK